MSCSIRQRSPLQARAFPPFDDAVKAIGALRECGASLGFFLVNNSFARAKSHGKHIPDALIVRHDLRRECRTRQEIPYGRDRSERAPIAEDKVRIQSQRPLSEGTRQ